MTAVRWGIGLTLAGAATLIVAVLAMLPWILGQELDCEQAGGPHPFFLLAWPIGPALAFSGSIVLLRVPRHALRSRLRRGAIVFGFAVVPLAAVVWWVVVLADGVKECGF